MSTTPAAGQVAAPVRKRYGCFAGRIGAPFNHKLENNLTLPSGRLLRKGIVIHLDLQDLTRHPECADHTKWVCRHPDCRGKEWKTKQSLIADHPDNRILDKQEEAHCYYAVAWMPGVEAKPEKRGKAGEIVEEAVEAKLPSLMLLSDEE